jgi:indolepyruvate ferredoxin oxidoreductase beta subunit
MSIAAASASTSAGLRPTGVLMSGVGGQGIILASEVLSEVALLAGLDVKKSEVHGMAQRGGSVISHVRFGSRVASPIIPEGEADILVAFEEMEGLRYLHLVRSGGTVIVNRQRILTLAMLTGSTPYPDDRMSTLGALPLTVRYLDGPAIARAAGNPKTVSVAVLGALATLLSFTDDQWREAIARRIPARIVEVNWSAFVRGRDDAASRRENA